MTKPSDLEALKKESQTELQNLSTLVALNTFQIEWLGRKGKLTTLLKNLASLPLEEKKTVGKLANELKTTLEDQIAQKERGLKQKDMEKQLSEETFDLSLPGTPHPHGHTHPLSRVLEELVSIFSAIGFVCADGPEIESEFYNFEALNIPANHPARDMQDTFYLKSESRSQNAETPTLLRTHTSPVQIRILQKYPPPVAIVVPGRVYRHEAMDATHGAVFHQLEGLLVGEQISFADLKGALSHFARQFFGPTVKTRFRPSYFPFTEPSAEMDISCRLCQGKGCSVCKHSGWTEVLGAGLVNPKVFEAVSLDAEKYSGFAFGMGIERLAMLKYGINDLRLFYENDLRFLSQF